MLNNKRESNPRFDTMDSTPWKFSNEPPQTVSGFSGSGSCGVKKSCVLSVLSKTKSIFFNASFKATAGKKFRRILRIEERLASSSTSWLFALNEGVNVPMPSICTGWPSWMKVFIA